MNFQLILKTLFQSPRNLNLNNKAKPVETQQKPTSGKKKSSGSSTTNPTEVEDNATNPQEILIDKIATAKADTLKFILNDLNGKIVSASSQISE